MRHFKMKSYVVLQDLTPFLFIFPNANCSFLEFERRYLLYYNRADSEVETTSKGMLYSGRKGKEMP